MNPIGNPSYRSARQNPAQCQPRRPLMTLTPIAHDPAGVPGGVRINLADEHGIVWLDLSRVDAERLVAQIGTLLAR